MTRHPTADGADGPALPPSEQRRAVRQRYGRLADVGGEGRCCGGTDSSRHEPAGDGPPSADAPCCGDEAESGSCAVGDSAHEADSVAPGADLGLGCGDPTALAELEAGQTVLDLGAGGGFDCFLAAQEVGPDGRVIGVDMTPEMVERARRNVGQNDAANVEFRLGEIEHLPVADERVDVVVSNCVVNLSPDKPRALREAYRVLRPGGRLAISDIVRTGPLPDDIRADPTSVAACIAGAAPVSALEAMLTEAGFEDVSIELDDESAAVVREWDPDRDLSEAVVAASIEAAKPAAEAER